MTTATAKTESTPAEALQGAALFFGVPLDTWDAVQAAQDEPFVYFQGGEHQFLRFLEAIHANPLDVERFDGFETENPCAAVDVVENGVRSWVDGEPFYRNPNTVRFFGNFADFSCAFSIDTNHAPFITALRGAIASNLDRQNLSRAS